MGEDLPLHVGGANSMPRQIKRLWDHRGPGRCGLRSKVVGHPKAASLGFYSGRWALPHKMRDSPNLEGGPDGEEPKRMTNAH